MPNAYGGNPSVAIVQLLVEHDLLNKSNALCLAIRENYQDLAYFLLDSGTDINTLFTIRTTDIETELFELHLPFCIEKYY